MNLINIHTCILLSERHQTGLSDFGSVGDFENMVDSSHPAATTLTRLPSISRMVDAQELRRKRRHQFRASASLDNCKTI